MGTYRNPGSTPGVSIAGEISTGISEISKTGRDKRDLVNKFQKEALEEKRKQQDLIDQLEDVDEKNPINSMLEGFNGRVDEAYNMKLKSFGGDTSEYDKYYQDTQKILEDIIPATGIIDKTIEDFNKMSPSERNKAILRSPFVGEDADKRNKYKALLEDPSKMGYRFKGDKIIITYDDEELFNASALINATKNGFSLLEKATDYSPELKIVGDEAYQNLANLKEIQSIETKDENTITTEEKVLYSDAMEEFEKRLRAEENSKLQALVNESNYQRFITGENTFDFDKNGKETKEAIIKHLIDMRFPQGREFLSKTQVKDDTPKPMTEYQEKLISLQQKKLNERIEDQKRIEKNKNKEQNKINNKLLENRRIVNDISSSSLGELYQIDQYANALNKLSGKEYSYIGGSNNEIIDLRVQELEKRREQEENPKKVTKEEREEILKQEANKIYKKTKGGSYEPVKFDINDPEDLFEKLSIETIGIEEKDITNFDFNKESKKTAEYYLNLSKREK